MYNAEWEEKYLHMSLLPRIEISMEFLQFGFFTEFKGFISYFPVSKT